MLAECDGCGAQCGEVRKQTMGEGTPEQWEAQAKREAMIEWNTRTPPTGTNSGLIHSNYLNNNAEIQQMREEFEKLFRVPDGVVFEDGEYLPVISGDCFGRGKNEDMAKLTNFAWMAFQDTKDNAEGAHTVSIHPETWEKLREMNGDAWECDGHRELVVDTMLNYAYPHFLEKSRSGLF